MAAACLRGSLVALLGASETVKLFLRRSLPQDPDSSGIGAEI
jgi:hypothetical protein